MGLLDVLLGRKRLKDSQGEKLFALPAATVTMQAELDLKPAGKAAVCFKPLSAGDFVRAENELQELLDIAAQETASRIRRKSDELGFEWLVVEDPDFEDLVTTVHLIGSELKTRGFGAQLLAAIFRFEQKGRPVYWIYGYKRGAFWPFVPGANERERDNAEELELKAKLEKELPIEKDLTKWLALYDAPI
jgi:hypothetical protein